MRKLQANTLAITDLDILKDHHLLIQKEMEDIAPEAEDTIPERDIRGRDTPETKGPDLTREFLEDVVDIEIETEKEIDLDITPDPMTDTEIVADLDHQGESKTILHSSVLYMNSFIKST